MKKHEIWIDKNNLPGLCLSGPVGNEFRELLDKPAKLIHEFMAESHLEAMKYYYKYMEFGEYQTDHPEIDALPYQ